MSYLAGNIRELENIVEYAVNMSDDIIDIDDIPESILYEEFK